MEIKAFIGTMALGMVAGAAAALMLPKQSPVYKAASNAADTVKQTVSDAFDNLDF